MDPNKEQLNTTIKIHETAISHFQSLISQRSSNNPIPGNFAESVSHPDYLNPKEKVALIVMMTRELVLAGKDTPTEIEGLSASYMGLLVERKKQRKDEASTTSPETVKTIQSMDHKTRYLTDRQILPLIRKVHLEKAILSDVEKKMLENSVRVRIGAGGVAANFQGVDAWISAYQQYKIQEIQANTGKWDYDRFCKENPYVTINGLQMASYQPEITTTNVGTFKIEHSVGVNDRVAVLTVPDKEDDTVGVVKNPDGTISMAIADGVSGTVLPQFASRTAVWVALEDMKDKPPSSDTFKAAFDKIQESDLTTMASNLDRSIAEKDAIETKINPNSGSGLSNWRRTLKELGEKGAYANTTLALARYDKQNSRLQIAVKGDSSIIVFKADGTYNVYQDPTNRQIYYNLQPTAQYNKVGEIIQDILLDPEDVVLLCSDGADESSYPKIFDNLNNLITTSRGKQSGEKLDFTVTNYIKEQVRTGVGDDVSAIALHHKIV